MTKPYDLANFRLRDIKLSLNMNTELERYDVHSSHNRNL